MKVEHYSSVRYLQQSQRPFSSFASNAGVNNLQNTALQSFISDFPKSYVKINNHPSFGISIEEQRKIELETRIQQDKNDYLWAKSWNPQKAEQEVKERAEKQIAIRKKEAFAYLKNSSKEEIKFGYNWEFKRQKEKYDLIMANKSYYENLLQGDLRTRQRTASEILLNSRGKLNAKIAGYESLKKDMRNVFIDPVTKELLEGGEQKVANGILLCGPTGCGKTLAAEAVANETYCVVERIDTKLDPREFPESLDDKIKNAKNHYYEKQAEISKLKESAEYKQMSDEQKDEALKKIGSARTVLIIDEFDRYFNPITVPDEVIKTNTNSVKSVFDNCAELPNAESPNAAALTFICTTNYPQRIPKGDINMKKLVFYPVLPPKGKDMEDVIRLYCNKANKLIYEYRDDDPRIKQINTRELKLEKFAQMFEPTEKDGAFSNDAINFMVTSAAESYIDNPKFDFNIYLLREFKYSQRDIRPEKLKKYLEQIENLETEEKPLNMEIDYKNSSRREILEQKITNLTMFGEQFLTPKQKEQLANLRAEYDNLTD